MSDPRMLSAMSLDASTIINMLLVYKMASKLLPPEEVDIILCEGQKVLLDTFSKHVDKDKANEIIMNAINNTKNTINSMREKNG